MISLSEPLKCVCGGDGEIVYLGERHGIALTTKLCPCGLLRSDPYYGDEDLEEFYRGEYRERYRRMDKDEAFAAEAADGQALLGFLDSLGLSYQTALDVGCGAGGTTAVVPRCVGYDFDEEWVKYGRSRGAKIHTSPCEGTYDWVILSHVLEHEKRPVEFLKGIYEKTNKFVSVVVPGVLSIGATYPNIRDYLQDAHVFHYTLKTLMYVMSLAGFRLIAGAEPVVAFFEKGGEPLATPQLGPRIKEYLTHIAEVEAAQAVMYRRQDASYFSIHEPWV